MTDSAFQPPAKADLSGVPERVSRIVAEAVADSDRTVRIGFWPRLRRTRGTR